MLLQILTKVDSTIIVKINSLNDAVEKLDKKVTVNPWLPLVAAIIGGILIWIGQAIERSRKGKRELTNEKKELFAKVEMLLLGLKNSLRQLSTQKNLREYYWYCYIDEYNAKDKNVENEKKYLNDHYAACQEIVNVTNKIGELLAEYYSTASKFNLLAKNNYDLTFITNFATNTDFSDAKKISETLSTEDALIEYELNCKTLSNEYVTQVSPFDLLNNKIKTLIK
jgi:hypothetical protein